MKGLAVKINENDVSFKLKELIKDSNKLTYEYLIEQLLEITEHKLDRESYKFLFFLEWLYQDLEHSKTVNSYYWDMSFKEIDEDTTVNWEEEYNKHNLEFSCDIYKDLQDFKDNMLDWSYQYCIENIFNQLKKEFEYRKEEGLI